MKSVITCVAISAISLFVSAEAFAASRIGASGATQAAQPKTLGPSHITGQPNQSCGSQLAPNTPGNAASAPGSAFNPAPGTAGMVYAGQQPRNSRNTASVSQYDVACSHQP
jgi:hypothetical protein